MNNATLDALIWVLIYGGLLVLCLGLFVQRQDTVFGATLIAIGTAAAAAGCVLVWVRSRRQP